MDSNRTKRIVSVIEKLEWVLSEVTSQVTYILGVHMVCMVFCFLKLSPTGNSNRWEIVILDW